ncbi:CAP domain-containing protein [Bacillus shivajii]|uniref:CAP domain-containing protein n=1 Tax=Bacillus shivajii TaxID=1983719 RepID=UPI001CFA0B40|nr:CAP domain-containing protein [Bacillus shivajii]UCZ51855.1 CAP domain-containing protein [Bacillus shivajii]
MKSIISFLFAFIVVFGLFTLFFSDDREITEEKEERETSSYIEEDNSKESEKETEKKDKKTVSQEKKEEEGLHLWLGVSDKEIVDLFGEPVRKDLSPYGYDWWIYNEEEYLQIAILDGEVVSLFTNDHKFENGLFNVGDSYDEIDEVISFETNVSLSGSFSSYQFELNDEELNSRPLAKLDENVWVQFYFDTTERKLSSVRYMSPEILLLQRPYSIIYRGELPEREEFTNSDWQKIQEGQSKQIFDMTNMIRKRHGLDPLEWDEETAFVAFLHSEDMYINDYFSHTSPTAGELKDRLEAEYIHYQMAAENIAAKYVDAIAAVEGWLNSEGHRVNLLKEDFTHLGVGVYRDYYTQNFITPW